MQQHQEDSIRNTNNKADYRAYTNISLRTLHLIILSVLVCIIYYPALDAPFVFDDFPNIVANDFVHPEKTTDIFQALHSRLSSGRPLAMLSFAVNYRLHGLSVLGYHLFNTIIHLLNALILYSIITILPMWPSQQSGAEDTTNNSQLSLAFWSASLWAVNPVQTQAVTYIVQRMASMAALFYLAAIYLLIRWRRNTLAAAPAIAGITACFLLGMACKENVLTLPLALLLLDYLCLAGEKRKYHLALTVLTCIVLAGLGLFYLHGLPNWTAISPGRDFTPWQRTMTQWRIIWLYLADYFAPLPSRLHFAYDISLSTGLLLPWTTMAGLLSLAGSWLIAWLLRKKYPAAVFGFLFFFLAMSVESTFANIELSFLHRLYLPSAFLMYAVLTLLSRNIRQKAGPLLLVLIAVWSLWTIERNDEWNRAVQLWGTEHQRGTNPIRSMANRAAALIDIGSYREAITLLNKSLALETNENNSQVLLYNLGLAHYLLYENDTSLQYFRRLANEFGAPWQTYIFIGQLYLRMDMVERVRSMVADMTTEESLHLQRIILQANIHTWEKDYGKAEDLLLEEIATQPISDINTQVKLRLELARIYMLQLQIDQAKNLYLEIVDIFPQNYFAWTQLYRMLKMGGDEEGAEKIRVFLEDQGFAAEKNRQLTETESPVSSAAEVRSH